MTTAPPTPPKNFDELLFSLPKTPLLDAINSPADLKRLTDSELVALCDELRAFLLFSVPKSGGHFGANLGVIELTVALHSVLNCPKDKLLWDVGHQAYVHKILTGRRAQMTSIRSFGGLAAFPCRAESQYDCFGVGHSSTAISAGLGMSLAGRLTGNAQTVVCVVGDGAMTAGMAFEAMNDAVEQKADLLVILNDNDMSISQATGGFSKHLLKLWERGLAIDLDKHGRPILTKRTIASDDKRMRHYLHMASDVVGDLSGKIPAKIAQKLAQGLPRAQSVAALPDKLAQKIGAEVFPDNLFRAIGFQYFGPFDGHDVLKLTQVLRNVKTLKGAVLVHVHTVKGKGLSLAENDPVGYHSLTKLPKNSDVPKPAGKKFSEVFGQFLLDKAQSDPRLVAITPAMTEGSGMTAFAKAYPQRFFDVAIAEQHAVTLAAGMATCPEVKPIVAIYSTFLQRGYDQLIHDVALQQLDLTFALDRAGLVGEDGATHAGVFDLAYLRCVPNMVIATPSDENECYQLLNLCYEYAGPAAVRYPRGVGSGTQILSWDTQQEGMDFALGKSRPIWQSDNWIAAGTKIALLNFGTRLQAGLFAVQDLARQYGALGLGFVVLDMRFVKPLDGEKLRALLADNVRHFITLEEHQRMGGAGSAVNEFLLAENLPVWVKNLAIDDEFISHASHEQQLAQVGLDQTGIGRQIGAWFGALGLVD